MAWHRSCKKSDSGYQPVLTEVMTEFNYRQGSITFTATESGLYFIATSNPSFDGGLAYFTIQSDHTPIYRSGDNIDANSPYALCELDAGDTVTYTPNPNYSCFAVYKVNGTTGQKIYDVKTADRMHTWVPTETNRALMIVTWSGREDNSTYVRDNSTIRAKECYRYYTGRANMYVLVTDNLSLNYFQVYGYYYGECRILAIDLT